MNPQDEQNTNPGGLVGGEVSSATPPVETPVTAEAAEPIAPPVSPDPVPAEPTPASNAFSVGPTEPTLSTDEPMPTASIAVNGKKSKKGLFIVLIILILALVGGGVAFMMWNNSDDRIISDAWHGLFKEKNQITLEIKADIQTVDGPKFSVNASIDSISKGEDGSATIKVKVGGMSIDVKAEIIAKDGDVFLKADFGMLANQLGGDLSEYNGKWIKISKELVEQITSMSGAQIDTDSTTCISNAAKSLINSVAKQDELLDILEGSNLYSYQRAGADGDLITYDLTLNYSETNAKALVEKLIGTGYYKDLSACPGFENLNAAVQDTGEIWQDSISDPEAKIPDISAAFTVNGKTHEFHGLSVTLTIEDGTVITIKLTGSTSNQSNVNILVPEGEIIDAVELFTNLPGKDGLLPIL